MSYRFFQMLKYFVLDVTLLPSWLRPIFERGFHLSSFKTEQVYGFLDCTPPW